jgi:hypothetical protein
MGEPRRPCQQVLPLSQKSPRENVAVLVYQVCLAGKPAARGSVFEPALDQRGGLGLKDKPEAERSGLVIKSDRLANMSEWRLLTWAERGLLGAYRVAAPWLRTIPTGTEAFIQFNPSCGRNQQSAQNDQGKKSRQNIASLKVVPNRGETPSEFHKSSFDLRLLVAAFS